jgi:hypothetical protein
VPRIEARLTTYAFRFEAAAQLAEAAAVLQTHAAAQRELRASACFGAVLALALALGNFLNWGSRLGQAAGFRLKNLIKLQVHARRGMPAKVCACMSACRTVPMQRAGMVMLCTAVDQSVVGQCTSALWLKNQLMSPWPLHE